MIKLYERGVYLLDGAQIVEDTENAQVPLSIYGSSIQQVTK